MKKIFLRLTALMLMAGLLSTAAVQAQTVTGQDDFGSGFDGANNPIGGNQVFKSRIAIPNNQGFAGFGGAPGTFGGSFYDYYGITDRRINFDVADDSAGTFAPDQFGFAVTSGNPGDCVNFLVMADTVNTLNKTGIVTMDWEFDITHPGGSPYDIHRISLDAVAYGDFEDTDVATFAGGVDVLDPSPAFDFTLTADQDNADILYTVTMEGGNTYDFYFDPFFQEENWDCLILMGPGFCAATGDTVNYHPLDNGGSGDDGVAFNGFIAEPTANSSQGDVTRAYTDGSFDEQEIRPYRDPLIEQNSLVQLGRDKTRFSALYKGAGDCFLLSMVASANSDAEVIAFDNILLESAVLGDANDDGNFTNSDIQPFVLALTNPNAYAAAFPGVDPNFVFDFDCNGVFTNADISGFVNKLLNP